MITDPIFYRLFETSPETFFMLLGSTPEVARELATRYQFQAIEFKETSHRADGVFLPKKPGEKLYFLEVQFYRLPTVFVNLMVKVFTYLEQNNPAQDFCAVVLFESRSLEPDALVPVEGLITRGQLRRFYLDEMAEPENAPLGLSVIYLIRQSETNAPGKARELILRAKSEIDDVEVRKNLIGLIETVIVYKLPLLTRKEIEAMLKIHDIRESRVYREALEEGKEEGLKQGIEKGIEKGIAKTIAKLASKKKMSVAEIAVLLDMDEEQVRTAMAAEQ
jgi:predicted transposase/invertase (TIGR01784 family)